MDIRSPSAKVDTPRELESETAQRMVESATTFLACLSPGQREKVVFRVEDEERFNWHYIPKDRCGLSLKEMDSSQQKFLHVLLSSGLSRRGYAKAVSIMGLESTLARLEGSGGRFIRDPDLYYATIFGAPSLESPWGWRLEGHHISVNFLIVEGNRIAPTPNFFGANPARVPDGDLSGLRVLAAEEDLARSLLGSLDDSGRERAVISDVAPRDILTREEKRVKPDSPDGIGGEAMTEDQRGKMMDLVMEFITRMPEDVADMRMNRIEKDGTAYIHFAWAGSDEPGRGHYYRLQGPSFFVEYDNTQNQANHIHTVWRDMSDEWGDDLLARHYARSHRDRGAG